MADEVRETAPPQNPIERFQNEYPNAFNLVQGNLVLKEFQDFDFIAPEFKYSNSRIKSSEFNVIITPKGFILYLYKIKPGFGDIDAESINLADFNLGNISNIDFSHRQPYEYSNIKIQGIKNPNNAINIRVRKFESEEDSLVKKLFSEANKFPPNKQIVDKSTILDTREARLEQDKAVTPRTERNTYLSNIATFFGNYPHAFSMKEFPGIIEDPILVMNYNQNLIITRAGIIKSDFFSDSGIKPENFILSGFSRKDKNSNTVTVVGKNDFKNIKYTYECMSLEEFGEEAFFRYLQLIDDAHGTDPLPLDYYPNLLYLQDLAKTSANYTYENQKLEIEQGLGYSPKN